MLGLDVYNGNPAQVTGYRNRTRVTFPLLQRAAGGMRTFRLEDLVVVDRKGIVRYLGKIGVSTNLQRAQETIDLLLSQKPVVAPITQPLMFENLYLGDTQTQQIQISNTGNADLEITGLQTDLTSLTTTLPLTVPAGETRTVDLTFMPDQTGEISGTIQLITNTDPIQISLTPLQVQPPPQPAIAVQQSHIDFGTFEQTEATAQTVTIQNTGTSTLTITNIQSDLTNLRLSQTQLTIEPNSSADLTLSIHYEIPEPFNGDLKIFSDDPNTPTLTLSISGERKIIVTELATDFNSDGKVDFTDFLSFAAAYGSSQPAFDLDQSGQVDFPDFLAFAQSFGKSLN